MTCSMEARVTTAPDRAPARLSVAPPDPTLVGATEARKDVPTRPDARGAVADAPATAAVQRVEKQASTLMVEVRQCRRSEEEWRVQGEEARAEVAALQIQFNEAVRKKEEAMQELHQTREMLEGKMDGVRKAFAEAEARCKLYMTENDRLQKEITTMREELRKAEQLRKAHEELEREYKDRKSVV